MAGRNNSSMSGVSRGVPGVDRSHRFQTGSAGPWGSEELPQISGVTRQGATRQGCSQKAGLFLVGSRAWGNATNAEATLSSM